MPSCTSAARAETKLARQRSAAPTVCKRSGVRLALLILVTCSHPAALWAQDAAPIGHHPGYLHIVQSGETLASIAQRYYGDPRREGILVAENGLTSQGGSVIVVGQRLVIPHVRYYRVAADDTWRSLATRFYGSGSRASAILRANDARPKRGPDPGAQLIIPYPLRHTVTQPDTFGRIAELYLGKRSLARWLRRFNKLKPGRLQRGQIVLIPLADLVLSEEGRAHVTQATGQRPEQGEARKRQAEIQQQLPELGELVKQGLYAEAVALANQLLGSGELTGNQELSIQRALAIAYVAMERQDLAVIAFEKALEKQPDLELDSTRTSPKVLRALDAARKSRAAKDQQADNTTR